MKTKQNKKVDQPSPSGSGDVKAKKRKIDNGVYEQELARLQIELVKMQEWVKHEGLKVVVIFEGRDAAGKGGVIKRITESLNPRICRVVALGRPTEREKTGWYFQRYVAHLPSAGEIVLFDRSWYNRAGVERVMGFCSDAEYNEFLRSCPEFERMLIRSGIMVVKYWFSVSDDEQERRFQKRMRDPTRSWKLSPMDVESRSRWIEYSKAKDQMFAHTDIKQAPWYRCAQTSGLSPWNTRSTWNEYSKAKDQMFAHTDIKQAPWYVVKADVKKCARLNCITHLLSLISFKDLTPTPPKLPPRPEAGSYLRPPIEEQTFVEEVW